MIIVMIDYGAAHEHRTGQTGHLNGIYMAESLAV